MCVCIHTHTHTHTYIYGTEGYVCVAQMERICLQCKRRGFNLWVGKIPWRRKWQPTLVFLPGEFHGQRNLAGYSSWGLKVSDTTE